MGEGRLVYIMMIVSHFLVFLMERIADNDPRLLGHPSGGIYNERPHSWRIVITITKPNYGGSVKVFAQYVYAKNFADSMEDAFAAAKVILQRESDARGLTYNKCVVLENGNIEMDLGHGYKMLFSPEKLDLIRPYRWYACKYDGSIYVKANFEGTTIFCHRLLLNAPKGMEVDHLKGTTLADGKTLDNTMANLRVVTGRINKQNQGISTRNTTGVIGVAILKKKGIFRGYFANWRDHDGRAHRKAFRVSVIKTAEQALMEATLHRHAMEDELCLETRRRVLMNLSVTKDNNSEHTKRKRNEDAAQETLTKKQKLADK